MKNYLILCFMVQVLFCQGQVKVGSGCGWSRLSQHYTRGGLSHFASCVNGHLWPHIWRGRNFDISPHFYPFWPEREETLLSHNHISKVFDPTYVHANKQSNPPAALVANFNANNFPPWLFSLVFLHSIIRFHVEELFFSCFFFVVFLKSYNTRQRSSSHLLASSKSSTMISSQSWTNRQCKLWCAVQFEPSICS